MFLKKSCKVKSVAFFFVAFLSIFFLGFLGSCGSKSAKEPSFTEKLDTLQSVYKVDKDRALSIRGEANWLTPDDCDGMIWSGKYAASHGVDDVDIEASEFEGDPGRFGRRPPPRCWNEQEGDVGSKTTWSRDMAICGLLPYAWQKGKKDLLVRHAEYGAKHWWKMGEPFDDGRVLYTPGIIGLLYQAIYALGGPDNANRYWPDVYPSGLDDYEAHLQMCNIWLRGEVAESLNEADALPKKQTEESLHLLNVSESMYNRIIEHAEREPQNSFFRFLEAKYVTGEFQPVVDLLIDHDYPHGSYVRCGDKEPKECALADKIFTTSLVLEYLGKL